MIYSIYVSGLDVIYQAPVGARRHMLCDGQGSVRQITGNTGTLLSGQEYDYDAYGVMTTGPASTSTPLLYAGEWYDTESKNYNLRARYYNPSIGRFTQTDPFEGDNEEPQSLHKYLYAHCNPINNIDPTGYFSIGEIVSVENISNLLRNVNLGTIYKVYNFADTTMTAINLLNQWRSSGNLNYLELGLLAASILPFGKLIGKVKISANRLINASEDLTKFLLEAGGRTNKVVATIGAMGAELTAHAKGFKPTNFIARYHGFDGIYKNGKRFVIVEAKGGTGKLAEKQMSKEWIYKNIKKMSNDPENAALAKKLRQAYNDNMIDGMVVTTEIIGDKVQDPTFVFKTIQEIGAESF